MSRRIRLVDVFGERPMTGNPLAVVIDSDGLSTEEMLEIAMWLNFSETTFLLPPNDAGADYRVRIFTLFGELPFAGHPTLGTCHVWQSISGDVGSEIVQECGAGLVRLRRTEDHLGFAAPDLLRSGPIEDGYLEEITSVLGIERSDVVASNWVDNGPGWAAVLLGDAGSVLALEPDFGRRAGHDRLVIGVVGFHPQGAETLYEVRAFFPGQTGSMTEDPVTGSLNASIAQWLIADGRAAPPFVASQGTALGRSGRIHIDADADGTVWVSGKVFDVVTGEM